MLSFILLLLNQCKGTAIISTTQPTLHELQVSLHEMAVLTHERHFLTFENKKSRKWKSSKCGCKNIQKNLNTYQ